MPCKILLFLGADSFHAYTWKNGVLSVEQRFADNPDGKEQFAAFLQNHPDPAYLLTDLIEEDFRYETVPHLRGGERTALIQGEQHWIPKSHIHDDSEVYEMGTNGRLVITQWIAEQKGLVP